MSSRQSVLNARQDFSVLARWMETLMCLGLTYPKSALKDIIVHQVGNSCVITSVIKSLQHIEAHVTQQQQG